MFVCICRPPKQDSQYFLENLSLIIDLYSSIYDNQIILRDFNMEPKNPKLAPFKHSSNLYDLILSNFDNANFQMDLKSKHNNCPKNTETLKKHLKTS